MKRLILYVLVSILLAGCEKDQSIKKMRLGHGHDVSHPVHQSMVHFASTLEIISGGTIKVWVYPNAQLGNEREMIELLQIGSLDFTKTSAAVMENFAEEYSMFSFPYLFTGEDHYKRFLNSPFRDSVLEASGRYKLYGLSLLDAGSRNFYTLNTRVHVPEDLQGLKLRVMQSNTALQMAKVLGASPTPIPQAELYTAIQQGIVDGAENNPITFYSKKHYEVCNYFIRSEHNFVPDIFLMSSKTYGRLTVKEQKLVKAATDSMMAFYNERWGKQEKIAVQALQDHGITFIEPEKAAFIKKSHSFYENMQESKLKQLAMKIRAL